MHTHTIHTRDYHRFNLPMLCRTMGWLVLIESLFMLIPCLTSLYYSEDDWKGFAVSAFATAMCGLLLTNCVKPATTRMGKREGFLLTGLVWVFFSFFGMLPFIICSSPYTFSDAYMEAMAGFTTTGCVIIPDVEILTHGVQMWRALMQWLGGMGIVIFTLAVIPMLDHSGGLQMYNAEVTGITHEKLSPRISETAKKLWFIYMIMTLMCMVCLCMGPVRIFDGVVQSLGTISTGGFSPYNDGVNHYGSIYVKLVLTIFMFLGGINFSLVYAMAHGNFHNVKRNQPLRWFVGGVVVFTLLFFALVMIRGVYSNAGTGFVDSLFQTVALMTTTGYGIDTVPRWGAFVIIIMVLLMWTGGCAGSTSGGVKNDRVIVLLLFMRNEIHRVLQPYSMPSVKLNGKVMSPTLVTKVVAFLSLNIVIIIITALILALLGVPMVDSVYSALSCITNSGICLGLGHFGGAFDQIPPVGKCLLSFVMMVGRLEIFTVLVLFSRSFWHRQ